MTLGVVVWLALPLVMPVVAQEDDEPAEEATPVPTTMPVASPPAMPPSSSPVPAATTDLGFPAPPAVAAGVKAERYDAAFCGR